MEITDTVNAAGTALDVSYLIDFLPSYLFPNSERQIQQWLVAGKSLGGHSTWIASVHGIISINSADPCQPYLFLEPRISLAVPIIACPDYTKLISRRAKYSHIDLIRLASLTGFVSISRTTILHRRRTLHQTSRIRFLARRSSSCPAVPTNLYPSHALRSS
jgi:hypothetical protein